jgi:hypothetical protein
MLNQNVLAFLLFLYDSAHFDFNREELSMRSLCFVSMLTNFCLFFFNLSFSSWAATYTNWRAASATYLPKLQFS